MLMLCDGAHKRSSLLPHHHHHLHPTSAYSLLTGGRRILFFKPTEDCCFCFRLFMWVVSVAVAAGQRGLQTEQYSKSTRQPVGQPDTLKNPDGLAKYQFSPPFKDPSSWTCMSTRSGPRPSRTWLLPLSLVRDQVKLFVKHEQMFTENEYLLSSLTVSHKTINYTLE